MPARGDEIVRFAPVGPSDMAAAEQRPMTSIAFPCSSIPASSSSDRLPPRGYCCGSAAMIGLHSGQKCSAAKVVNGAGVDGDTTSACT